MLTKNYGNVSSNNEVIAKTSSAFLKFSKRKDGHFSPQFMFDANHFHIEATLGTTDSDKLSKQSS